MPMTMSDIARLAGVQRPVVSMWRTRYATGRKAFPAPLPQSGQHGALLFYDDAILAWLAKTGLGNNPDAQVEHPLHATALTHLTQRPDEASALLLLHHVAQSPPSALTAPELDEAILLAQLAPDLLPPDLDLTHPSIAALLPDVEAVAEAAFTAEDALTRLVESFDTDTDTGAWGASSLTAEARTLLSAVLTEVQTESPLALAPSSLGAVALLARTLPPAEIAGIRQVMALPRLLGSPRGRAAWRLLAARGHDVRVVDAALAEDDALPRPGSYLALATLSTDSSAATELDEVLLALGPADRALVLGPASLLTGVAGHEDRGELLTAANASGISLRYAARLPKGMQVRSIRRRLALWVLAGRDSVPPSSTTVTADHGDARLTRGVAQAIAADVAVVMTGDPHTIKNHAFRAGGPRDAQTLEALEDITAPRQAGSEPRMGADLLAEALHLAPDMVATLDPHASRAAAAEERVSWAELTRHYGSDRPGLRLPAGKLTDTGPGTVAAIGAEEVRGTLPWDGRRIDRLDLEEVDPRARFTEPGDVVYVSAGGPAAVVDDVGGHLVLAPARVFRAGRPTSDGPDVRCAAPGLVAADIAAQRVPDKDAWRIRLTRQRQAPGIERLRREAAARRAALLEQLDRVTRTEHLLMQGLAAGTVRLAPERGPQ